MSNTVAKFLLRQDTEERFIQFDPILSMGEPALTTDSGIYKIGNGITPWSGLPITNIYTTPDPILKPMNISPEASAIVNDNQVTLVSSDYSSLYNIEHTHSQFQIATDSVFDTVVYDSGWVTATTSQLVTGLDFGTTYYWRVRYLNAKLENSSWSDGTGFSTLTNSLIGTFTQLANAPVSRYGHAVGLIGTSLYVYGGWTTALTYDNRFYNFGTGVWTTRSSSTRTEGVRYCGSCVVGTDIYYIGSYTGSGAVRTYFDRYSTTGNTWTAGTAPFASFASSMGHYNGNIYVMAYNSTANLSSNKIWRYNISGNQWTELPATLPMAFGAAGYTVVGSDLYFFGGRDQGSWIDTSYTKQYNRMFKFDMANETLSEITLSGTIPSTRGYCKMDYLNGYFYVYSGLSASNGALKGFWKISPAGVCTAYTVPAEHPALTQNIIVAYGSSIYAIMGASGSTAINYMYKID